MYCLHHAGNTFLFDLLGVISEGVISGLQTNVEIKIETKMCLSPMSVLELIGSCLYEHRIVHFIPLKWDAYIFHMPWLWQVMIPKPPTFIVHVHIVLSLWMFLISICHLQYLRFYCNDDRFK